MLIQVDAALRAVHGGVQAVIVADGNNLGTVESILLGEKTGTMFIQQHDSKSPLTVQSTNSLASLDTSVVAAEMVQSITEPSSLSAEQIAIGARDGNRQLCSLTADARTKILHAMASAIESREGEIMAANERDLLAATQR